MSLHRQEQCQKMLEALDRAGAGMTRSEFAELLGIKKSQHLLGLIKELLERDLATVKRGVNRNNRPVFIYYSIGAAHAEKE